MYSYIFLHFLIPFFTLKVQSQTWKCFAGLPVELNKCTVKAFCAFRVLVQFFKVAFCS